MNELSLQNFSQIRNLYMYTYLQRYFGNRVSTPFGVCLEPFEKCSRIYPSLKRFFVSNPKVWNRFQTQVDKGIVWTFLLTWNVTWEFAFGILEHFYQNNLCLCGPNWRPSWNSEQVLSFFKLIETTVAKWRVHCVWMWKNILKATRSEGDQSLRKLSNFLFSFSALGPHDSP